MAETSRACQATSRNQACYGHLAIEAEPHPDASDFRFSQSGDIADLFEVSSLRLSSLDSVGATGSPAQAQPAAATSAFPVSQVSWDPAIMKHLAGSNTDRGEKLAGEVCATCHGDKGLSQTATIPSLAGQTSYAIYKQLHDYRSGARVNDQMTGVAKALAVEDLASIAAFYAAAGAQYAAIGNRDLSGEPEIIKLVWEGDTRRRIPACMSCHTNGVGGPIETPALLGQNREYMVAQLNAYADKSRKNDVYGRMRDIARRLTPEEREKLARYLQGTL